MLAIKRALCLVIVVCLPTLSWPATTSCKFKRGDSDGNGTVQITDAQHLWNYAYQGGPAPPNLDAADANDDGYINGNDSGFISLYLFSGGSAPPDPGPTTADCDPTTSDSLETSCTPVGSWTVASVTRVPSTMDGVAAWDCNASAMLVSGGQLDPRKIGIWSENSEATESASCPQGTPTDELTSTPCCDREHNPCSHSDTVTRWTFTWTISSSPSVERLAFTTGCTKLLMNLDWRADFLTGPPACSQQDGDCPNGDDWLRWQQENVQIRFTFKNQTTLQTHDQDVSWYDPFAFSVSAYSSPQGGNPCNGLDVTASPPSQIRSKNVNVTSVGWTGNDQWKLEKIRVSFLRVFDGFQEDNADEEIITNMADSWSVYLQTLQYDNL